MSIKINLWILLITFLSSIQTVFAQDYYVYVTAESEDEVALVRFNAQDKKAYVEKRIPVGYKPSENEGPHGITIAPDGKHWYLSMAHGSPNGFLYKFATGSDQLVGRTTLGLFPASMQISSTTGYLFCVNFNLHGKMIPSTVSVVDPVSMTEITQVSVGTMPHGSRITPDGMKQYSVGMMSGDLFEINTINFQVERILNLDKNMSVNPDKYGKMDNMQASMDMSNEDHSTHMNHQNHQQHQMRHSAAKPTWVQPHPKKDLIYVAANGTDEILEIDSKSWKIVNRMKTGKAPYKPGYYSRWQKVDCILQS